MLWRSWKKSDNALVSGPRPCAEDEVGRGGRGKESRSGLCAGSGGRLVLKRSFILTRRTRLTLAPLTGQWRRANERNLEEP